LKSVLREAWPALAWAAFILVLTSVRPPAMAWAPDRLPLDKLVHLGVYGVLGWTIAGSVDRLGGSARSWIIAVALGIAFAAADEWHQTWIAGRDPSAGDWLADCIGLAVGMTAHCATHDAAR
jgi:VanZ family protein